MENIYIFMYASTKVLLILCFFGQKENSFLFCLWQSEEGQKGFFLLLV